MMPVIRLSDATWERLKAYARPFEDKPEDIVVLALNALDEKTGKKANVRVEPKKPSPRPRGEKLPQKQFRTPLVTELFRMGGSAHVSALRPVMEKVMAPQLSEADYENVSTGEPRWWNAICWERNDLVKEGYFRKHDRRGVWTLSDKGVALAKSMVE